MASPLPTPYSSFTSDSSPYSPIYPSSFFTTTSLLSDPAASTSLISATSSRKKTMAKARRFYKFEKLSMELQLIIWELAEGPRIIRAEWEPGQDFERPVFKLFAGPVPSFLHVNKSARSEALKKYKPILSCSTFHRDSKAGRLDKSCIYVNWEIDTLYFVNMPEIASCLAWTKNVLNNSELIKVAFHNQIVRETLCRPLNINFFFQLIMQQPSITTIIEVLDKSKFKDTKKAAKYHFYASKPPNTRWSFVFLHRVGTQIEEDGWKAPRGGFGAGVSGSYKAKQWNDFWVKRGGMAFKGPEWKTVTIRMGKDSI